MREKLQRLRVTTEKDMIIVCLPHSSTNLSTLVCLLLSIVMFLLIIATVKRHAANRIERVRLEESRKENSIRLLSFSTLFFYPNPDHRQFSSAYNSPNPQETCGTFMSLTLPPSCHICIFVVAVRYHLIYLFIHLSILKFTWRSRISFSSSSSLFLSFVLFVFCYFFRRCLRVTRSSSFSRLDHQLP